MKKLTFGLLILWALAGAVGLLTPAFGQEVTASIVGTVTDASNAPIKDATVTATDTDRGTVWTDHTNDAGAYNLLRLPIGNYTVKVTKEGFQSAVQAALTLVLNQTARVDVQLKVGKVSETVEVTSATPQLQTESTEVSTLIDATAVTSVPLAGRNYLQLGLLAPGTTTNNPRGINEPQNLDNGSRPFINGNREQANQYLLDGQLNSEDKNNETAYTPNVDAIADFNIITQNPSAEFGDFEGGVVSVSTKAGTNKYHGSVYEFWRNDKLDANLPSNGWSTGVGSLENLPAQGQIVPGHAADGTTLKPEFRYNQFGVTFGGPIIKDKLFFFVDYQGLRDLNSGANGAQLLTQNMRNGDFGQLCTQLNGAFNASGICSTVNPTLKVTPIQLTDPLHGGANVPFNNFANTTDTISGVANNLFTQFQKYYPLPQINSIAGGNNYFYNTGTSINTDQGDVRIDYKKSEKDNMFGRWSQAHLRNPAFSGCLFCNSGAEQGADQPMRNATVSWFHVFSPTLLNEVRFGFNAVQFNESLVQTSALGNVGQQLGINNANAELPGLLLISITGVGNGANPSLGAQNLVQIFHTTQAQINDNISITHGKHSLKTGFEFVRERQDFQYNGNNGGLGSIPVSSQSGSGLSDLYLGLSVTGGARDTYAQQSLFKHRGNIIAGYIQDNWRVTNTTTLNLGLRFEDHTPLFETEAREVNFGLFTGTIYTPDGINSTTKFSNPALYNNYLGKGDWQPRIGFSWAPAALGGRTVIRAGYAISNFFEGGGTNEQLTMNPPLGIYAQGNVGGTLAQGYGTLNVCPAVNFACYAGKRIRVTDQNFKPAISQQWNLTIQHQLNRTTSFQIGYVGQHGTDLLNFEDIAQRIGLNAAGQIAKPGQPIMSEMAGPYLGGGYTPCKSASLSTCGAALSLYQADQGGALAGANMSNSNQRYDSLQAVLQKRMGSGLQGQVAYTYSKCLSNSPGYFGTGWGSTGATSSGGQPGPQNIYDPHSDWGPCFFDQTHVLASYVTYQLPFGKGKQFGKDLSPALNSVIGNWEIGAIISAHSGNALTLNEFGGWGAFNGDPSNTNGIGPSTLSERPNCNGPIGILDHRVAATSAAPGYIQWFDPTNVSHPIAPAGSLGVFGTCSVGNIRGPKYVDFDMSLHKNFLITEGTHLEFRLEALNAFNHPVWTFSGGPAGGSFDPGTPVVSTTGNPTNNPNFGTITGSQSARSLQLGLKYIF